MVISISVGGFFMLITKYQGRFRKVKKNLEVIKSLKQELVRLGYKSHEVDRMIRIAGVNYPIRTLSGNKSQKWKKRCRTR